MLAAGAFLAMLPLLASTLGGRAFLFRDLSNIMLPYKATWALAVRELGRIPHWDPLHTGGFRFVADLNYGPLYPLNILFLFTSSATSTAHALSAFITIHHALIFTGFFLFFRERRLRPSVCLLGAVLVAWCGPAVSSDNLLHHLCAQASVGFFLFFWTRALKGSRAAIFGASAALAWPFYGGDPQYSYLMALVALLMLVLSRLRWKQAIARYTALGALSVLAAAPQLFPTMHYLRSTGRMLEALSNEDKLSFSLHPLRLAELLFPVPFGAAPGDFGPLYLLNGGSLPFLFSLFAGSVACTLALFHFSLRPIPSAKRRLQLSAVAVLLLLCLGSRSPVPLYSWALDFVPFWGNFRYPERLGYWLTLALLLFATFGAEKLLRLSAAHAKLRWKMPAVFFLAVSLGFGAWLLAEGKSVLPVAHAFVFFAFTVGLLKSRLGTSAKAAMLCALALADVAPIAYRLAWTQPVQLVEANTYPWAVKILEDQKKNAALIDAGGAHRFFSAVSTRLAPPVAAEEAESSLYSVWAGMKFNTPSAWGLALVRGHSSLVPNPPVLQLTSRGELLAQRVLDLYSTRYLLLLENGVPRANVRSKALPQASIPHEVESISDQAALVARLASVDWKPEQSALLEKEPGQEKTSGSATITRLQRHWDSIQVGARADSPLSARWLLVNESYDPFWTASLGGKNLRIVRANGWAMAIELPALEAGTFELRLEYRDVWLSYGQYAFYVWCLLALGSYLFLPKDLAISLSTITSGIRPKTAI